MTQPRRPPPGVETTPGGSIVPLSQAAKRLGKDPRTIIRAIKAGEIRGGAMPRPERLRWYVYADELPSPGGAAAPPPPTEVDELRAQVVSLTEANRLLIASQQDLLEADRSTNEAADKYRAVAHRYLDALAQFMTPGHLGELTELL
ncbi:hypothetical protein ACQI5H_22740 [Mycobacterium heidelbergense]|uniref:hypothetical protein n=1 Tax=Mycobacterium heidelbergense TaxID=53376 RepID=UPI003CF2D1B1